MFKELTAIYPFIELFASVIIISLAIYAFATNPKDKTSRAYGYFVLFMGLASLLEFCVRIAPSPLLADLFNRPKLVVWSVSFSVFIYFALAFTGRRKAISSPITFLLVFTPTFVLSIFYVFTRLLITGFIASPYGWLPDQTPAFRILFFGQMAGYELFGLILVLVASLRSQDVVFKKRGIIFFLAGMIPTIVTPINNAVLGSIYKIYLPLQAPAVGLAVLLIYFFSIRKYSLFTITPAEAVEVILETTSGTILAVDLNSKISFANASASSLLKIPVEEINGQPLARFLTQSDCQMVAKNLLAGGQQIKNHETTVRPADGEEKLVNLTAKLLLDPVGARLGGVIDLVDITEIRKTEENLKAHAEEVEKMNKFMIGREHDMIRLKKQVNELLRELGRPPEYTF